MKHQTLFSKKDRIKKIKLLSAAILLGSLRIKISTMNIPNYSVGSKYNAIM